MEIGFLHLFSIAGFAVAGALVHRYWQAKRAKGGMWAAGYWWSEQDRRLGPG